MLLDKITFATTTARMNRLQVVKLLLRGGDGEGEGGGENPNYKAVVTGDLNIINFRGLLNFHG